MVDDLETPVLFLIIVEDIFGVIVLFILN